MTRIAVAGAAGRMGQRIIAGLCTDSQTQLTGALEVEGSPALGQDACALAGCKTMGVIVTDSPAAALHHADVLIDFTVADATLKTLQAVATAKKAMVIGTTGHNEAQLAAIKEQSAQVPIVMAPNMSIGINVMWKMIEVGAQALGNDFQVGISETHHVHKKDKPSGTALQIARILAAAFKKNLSEIPCESIRTGEVIGDHTTVFRSPDETLTITHHAETRDIFAIGAIHAAKWLAGKKPGLYDMQAVLGLKT